MADTHSIPVSEVPAPPLAETATRPEDYLEKQLDDWRWISQGRADRSLLLYVGQWIAVLNHTVVAADPSRVRLTELVQERFPHVTKRIVFALID